MAQYGFKKLKDYSARRAHRRYLIVACIVTILLLVTTGLLFTNNKTAQDGAVLAERESTSSEDYRGSTSTSGENKEPELKPEAPAAPAPSENGTQSGELDVVPEHLIQPKGLPTYQIDRVIDGDTIRIYYNGQSTKVRLIGIDTPETVHPHKPVECYGPQASNHAKQLLAGKREVAIELDESQGYTDRYGRLLAYVYVDGYQLNYEMLRFGYGEEYTYNTSYKYQDEFREAERYAEEADLGLWAPATCNGRP